MIRGQNRSKKCLPLEQLRADEAVSLAAKFGSGCIPGGAARVGGGGGGRGPAKCVHTVHTEQALVVLPGPAPRQATDSSALAETERFPIAMESGVRACGAWKRGGAGPLPRTDIIITTPPACLSVRCLAGRHPSRLPTPPPERRSRPRRSPSPLDSNFASNHKLRPALASPSAPPVSKSLGSRRARPGPDLWSSLSTA